MNDRAIRDAEDVAFLVYGVDARIRGENVMPEVLAGHTADSATPEELARISRIAGRVAEFYDRYARALREELGPNAEQNQGE